MPSEIEKQRSAIRYALDLIFPSKIESKTLRDLLENIRNQRVGPDESERKLIWTEGRRSLADELLKKGNDQTEPGVSQQHQIKEG